MAPAPQAGARPGSGVSNTHLGALPPASSRPWHSGKRARRDSGGDQWLCQRRKLASWAQGAVAHTRAASADWGGDEQRGRGHRGSVLMEKCVREAGSAAACAGGGWEGRGGWWAGGGAAARRTHGTWRGRAPTPGSCLDLGQAASPGEFSTLTWKVAFLPGMTCTSAWSS